MASRTERTEALAFLIELLELGVEYPDAQWQTVISYEVDGDLLQKDYDEYCLTGGMCYE
jgi:hypothetical protein